MSDPETRPIARPAAPTDWRPPGTAPVSVPPAEHAAILQAGQRQLEAYVRQGYAVYLVAGVAGVGKTQLLASYQRQRALEDDTVFLPQRSGRDGAVESTAPGSLVCYPVAAGGRKVVLVDASGESFRSLYPHQRQTTVTAADVEFLKLMAKSLHGLALLVDLTRLWQPLQDGDKEQVEIANWILILLRWLLYAGTHDAKSPLSFHEEVNRTAMLLKRRLPQPVLVLFSRADQLKGLPLPAEPPATSAPSGTPRKLFPPGEQALLFAYHAVPLLYRSVRTHCDHFHFDFAHSLLSDSTGKMIAERKPCGVATSLNWLLDPSWRWPGAIPSRRWIWLQQRLDRLRGRAGLWQRLPPPTAPR